MTEYSDKISDLVSKHNPPVPSSRDIRNLLAGAPPLVDAVVSLLDSDDEHSEQELGDRRRQRAPFNPQTSYFARAPQISPETEAKPVLISQATQTVRQIVRQTVPPQEMDPAPAAVMISRATQTSRAPVLAYVDIETQTMRRGTSPRIEAQTSPAMQVAGQADAHLDNNAMDVAPDIEMDAAPAVQGVDLLKLSPIKVPQGPGRDYSMPTLGKRDRDRGYDNSADNVEPRSILSRKQYLPRYGAREVKPLQPLQPVQIGSQNTPAAVKPAEIAPAGRPIRLAVRHSTPPRRLNLVQGVAQPGAPAKRIPLARLPPSGADDSTQQEIVAINLAIQAGRPLRFDQTRKEIPDIEGLWRQHWEWFAETRGIVQRTAES